MKILTNKYLIFVLRWLLGIVFIYAAFDKIVHPGEFARIIYHYRIVPGDLINIFALFLPALEVLAGLCLISGLWIKAANLLIAGMLSAFIAALLIALQTGINIECGCFSTTSHTRSAITDLLWRDVLMMLACILIYFSRESFLSLENKINGNSEPQISRRTS